MKHLSEIERGIFDLLELTLENLVVVERKYALTSRLGRTLSCIQTQSDSINMHKAPFVALCK